jgi:hypothetical protein
MLIEICEDIIAEVEKGEEGAISTLEKEIKKLKEENSIGNKFAAIFNKILEED